MVSEAALVMSVHSVALTWCVAMLLTCSASANAETLVTDSDPSDLHRPIFAASKTPVVDVYLSTDDGSRNIKQNDPTLALKYAGLDAAIDPNFQIHIDPSVQYQKMIGYGAALTDSAAWVLHSKNETLFNSIMEDLFGPSGLRLSILRINMGASDFTLGWNQNLTEYKLHNNLTYDDVEGDWDLTHFSTDRDDAHLLPVIRKAKELNPDLKIMGTTWTAPLWMKTSCKAHDGSPAKCTDYIGTGTLINDTRTYRAYGEYFAKFVESYRRKGVTVEYLTLQNEVLHPECGNDMPCMHLEAWQEALLAVQVARALDERGLGATKILGWDHNWDHPEYAIRLINREAPHISGLAWHCYGGDVTIQTKMHDLFPDKEIHMTECDSGVWSPSFRETLISDMNSLYIGGALNWAQSVIMWNIALDENHGPTCDGWACCKGCTPLVTVPNNAKTMSDVSKTVEYYSMAHLSAHVLPGARRIGVTQNNPPNYYGWTSPIQAVAFSVPSSKRLALVVANRGGTAVNCSFRVGNYGAFTFELPAGVVTFSLEDPGQHPSQDMALQSPVWMGDGSIWSLCVILVMLMVVACGAVGFGKRRRSKTHVGATYVCPEAAYDVLPGNPH